MPSENGWEPAQASPEQCEWVTVPGADVHLQLLKGQPLALLRAFAADFNAYVEQLRDADSAGWTPTNTVPTSNHLNGTAMDLNWEDHPFQVSYAGFDEAQIATIRELIGNSDGGFYEGTIQWGQDWGGDPYDCMHFNMGYNSYGNPHTQDVIDRKIRSDGFSTFRRGDATPPPPLSRADGYAVAIIREGQRRGITPRGIKIALATALVESNMLMYANESVLESMNLPHDAVGSDYDSVGLFQQRCPMWGPANVLMDPTQSAGLFYEHLAQLDYNGGDSPGSYAQAVQRSAFPDRYDQRWDEAVALYDRLAGVPAPQPVPEPEPEPEDWMADPQLAQMIREIHAALYDKKKSRSIYADEQEWTVIELIRNIDGVSFDDRTEKQAAYGDAWSKNAIRQLKDQGNAFAAAFLAQLETPPPPSAGPSPNLPPTAPPPPPQPTPTPTQPQPTGSLSITSAIARCKATIDELFG